MRKFISNSFSLVAVAFLLLLLVFGGTGRAFASPGARHQAAPPNTSNLQAWLTKEVRHELVMLPYYSVFDNLEFKVEGSTVTLIGQVVRGDVKNDAEKSVKKIEGVERVDNQIELLPASINDDEIRRAEFRAIYSDSGLSRYAIQNVPPIHIIVKNGHVTLEGAVGNLQDKQVAEIRAKGVPNVFSVTNNLHVDNGN